MANLDDVRKIGETLPGVSVSSEDGVALSVTFKGKLKGFAWSWAERIHPKKARVRNAGVLAVKVPNLSAKDLLLGADPEKFFTEPHYNGYPAILVRLEAIDPGELEDLLIEGWKTVAPKDLLAARAPDRSRADSSQVAGSHGSGGSPSAPPLA